MNNQKIAKKAFLLLNLGTPEAPTAPKVREYLKEFLMDPFVVDIPYLFRWFLIHILILPTRAASSAQLYQKIWTKRGSPLLVHLLDLAEEVQKKVGNSWLVQPAMRYGNPSIEAAFEVFQKAQIQDVLVFPLYPQYSLAATESSIQECKKIAEKKFPQLRLNFVPPFFQNTKWIDSFAAVAKESLKSYDYDHILMSFHGLPERQIKKIDSTQAHCLCSPDCCLKIKDANQNCYRAQCYETARGIAKSLQLDSSQYTVCFQSRLGRTPWIKPYTDEFYRELPKKGIRSLAVICPSFVADCLETLEEVQIRGKEEFLLHGGEDLRLVPSLNTSPLWVDFICGTLLGTSTES